MHTGLSYEENVDQRLSNIETMLVQGVGSTPSENAEIKASERFYNTVDQLGNKRIIALVAYSSGKNELKTIFNPITDKNSIRYKLANPPALRPGGWDLETLDTPKIVEGKFIRATAGEIKVIDLYRDGTFIFVALADQNFLCWGPNYSNLMKLNPLALMEVIYSFVRFYCEIVLNDLESQPTRFSIGVDLRNLHLDGIKSKLGPHGLESMAQIFNDFTKEAPSNDFSITKEFQNEGCDPARIAFILLKEIYLWFGIEEDKIPYTKLENGVSVVDPEKIKNPKK